MPNGLELPILEVGTATAASLEAALADRDLPGFLMKSGDRLRLVGDDELQGATALADLGVPVSIAGQPPIEARYVVSNIQALGGRHFAPGAREVGSASVSLKPRMGVARTYVAYTCAKGPHRVLAHRVRRPHNCPKHPSQTLKP